MSNQIDTDAKIIGEDYLGFGQNHIITDAGGILYACQINDSNEVEVHKSIDAGVNWTLDHSVAGLTNPRQLSMAKSELNDIFLCINHGDGTPSEFSIEKKDNGTGIWAQTHNHTDTGQSNALLYGLITYNRSLNRLHLVYAYNGANQFVRSIFSDDQGSTWSSVAAVGGTTFGNPTRAWGLDTDPGTGNIHHFGKGGGGSPQVHIMTPAGTNISTEGATGADASSTSLSGALVTDTSGNRWQFLYRENGGNFEILVKKNGATVLTDAFGASDDIFHGMQSISIDGDNNVYIVYTKRTDGKAYLRKHNAGDLDTVWQPELALTTGAGDRVESEQVIAGGNTGINFIFFDGP